MYTVCFISFALDRGAAIFLALLSIDGNISIDFPVEVHWLIYIDYKLNIVLLMKTL